MIDQQQIMAELQAIRDSQLFQRKKQISNFLDYIVKETLAKRSHQLTQYRIAVYALNKPKDFDPNDSPAVRMEASRLRKLLNAYYETEGFDNKVKIDLPLGSYIPCFVSNRENEHTIETSMGPIIAPCFQSLFLNDQTSLRIFHQIKNQLALVFSRFRYINVLSPFLINEQHVDDFQLLDQHPNLANADFMMMLVLEKDEETLQLTTHIYQRESKILIWNNRYRLNLPLSSNEVDRCYSNLAYEAFGEHHGIIYSYWSKALRNNTKQIPAYKQSLVSLNQCSTHSSAQYFQATIDICETRLQQHPNDFLTHLALAKTYLLWYLHQCEFEHDRLVTWLETCRKALQLDPNSAEAYMYFAAASFACGNHRMAQQKLEIAEKANPYDYSLKYFSAIINLLMGNTEKSIVLYKKTHEISLHHSIWHTLLPFLIHYQAQEYDIALNVVELFDNDNCWNIMMHIAALIQSKKYEKANQLLDRLNQQHAEKITKTKQQCLIYQAQPHLLGQIWKVLIDYNTFK